MSSKRAAGLIEAGVWLQMAGDVDGARDVYRQALALEPDNARAKRLFLAAGGVLQEPKKSPQPEAGTHSRYEPPPRQDPPPDRREPLFRREPPPQRRDPPFRREAAETPSRRELPESLDATRYEPPSASPARQEPPTRHEAPLPEEAAGDRTLIRQQEPAPASASGEETPAHPVPRHEAPGDRTTVHQPQDRAEAQAEEPPIPKVTPQPVTAREEGVQETEARAPEPAAPVEAPAESRGNEQTRIISLAELERAVSRTTPAPADKAAQVQALLKESAEVKAQGDLDKASGLVLRALVMDGTSLDAHEAAYVLLDLQGRTQAAEAELVHFLKLCADRQQAERAGPYLLTLVRLRPNDPETLALARQFGSASGDPNATIPASADTGTPVNRDSSRTLSDDPTATRPGRNKRNGGERPFGRRRR